MDYAMLGGLLQKILEKNIEKRQPNSMFMTEIVSIQQGVSDKELWESGAKLTRASMRVRRGLMPPAQWRLVRPPHPCACAPQRGGVYSPILILHSTGGSDPHGWSGQFHK